MPNEADLAPGLRPETFADWAHALPVLLRGRRLRLGLTYREAGELIGVPGSTVHKMEHGGDCRLSSVIKVARWLAEREVADDDSSGVTVESEQR